VRALGRAMRTDNGGVLRKTSRSERSMWAGQQLSLFSCSAGCRALYRTAVR